MKQDPRQVIVVQYLTMLAEQPSVAPDRNIADPLTRLRTIAVEYRRRDRELARCQAGFVNYAAAWAAANNITRAAFASMGVPEEVLELAAIAEDPSLVPTGADTDGSAHEPAAPDALSDAVSAAVEAVLERKVSGPFSVEDLSRVAAVEESAAAQAVAQLMASRMLESAGPNPWHRGKGRRAEMFIRSRVTVSAAAHQHVAGPARVAVPAG